MSHVAFGSPRLLQAPKTEALSTLFGEIGFQTDTMKSLLLPCACLGRRVAAMAIDSGATQPVESSEQSADVVPIGERQAGLGFTRLAVQTLRCSKRRRDAWPRTRSQRWKGSGLRLAADG